MKMHIALMVPGLPFQGDSLEEKSLGGSESAGLYMAREFAAKGQDVLCFTNTEKPGVYDGVNYRPIPEFKDYMRMSPHDVTIIQRMPGDFNFQTASKYNLVWCHDLALTRQSLGARGTLWNIDKFIVLSKFMFEQYRKTYGLHESELYQSRNGLDLDAFKGLAGLPRDPNKLMYTSRPERGMDLLLTNIFPRLLEENPDFRLHLAGYDNQVSERADLYQEMDRLIAQYGDRVIWLGNLKKDELYQHYATAGCLVYPTPGLTEKMFREISCITAMEAQACGLPIVTSNSGALPETLDKRAGRLIKGDAWGEEYADRFVKAVMSITTDDKLSTSMSKAGRRAAKKMSWSSIADKWLEEFHQYITSCNDSPERLARWFYKRSEIDGARKLLSKHPCQDLEQKINKNYGWFTDEASVQKHYIETVGPYYHARFQEKIAHAGEECFAHLFQQTKETRFHFFADFLSRHPDIQTVVDYGCGHGWCDIWLHNQTGKAVTGIDIEPVAIQWSDTFRDKYGKEPHKLKFIQGDHTTEPDGEYDLLIISEVLEHVFDPADVIDRMEAWVKKDGWVILTVPYGPMELADYDRLPFRNHVREFDHHDLRELLWEKGNVEVYTMGSKACEVTGLPLGYYIVVYQPNGEPCGGIDWDRKLSWQRPAQTVSACLMAGGPKASETAHWCLKSIRGIADEIIVADTGLDAETVRIFDQYDVRYVKSVDPRLHGFEEPRNHSIETATQDWILWIDTDEHLIQPRNVYKYLRENGFHAYGIYQHHFSIDGGFPPDMPCRLFRNRETDDGKKAKFFGAIHEHPELNLNEGLGAVIILSDVNIGHVGYLSEEIRRERFSRNYPLLELDKEKYPDRMLQKYFIMRDNMLLVMYEAQQNGGQLSPTMKQRCEEVRDIYREHFLGTNQLLNVDPLNYYTQAMQVLGEGIDVAFDVAAHRDGVGDQLNGGHKVRFATIEEAQKEISHRVKQRMEPLIPAHDWW